MAFGSDQLGALTRQVLSRQQLNVSASEYGGYSCSSLKSAEALAIELRATHRIPKLMAKQTPNFSAVRIWSFHTIFHGNKAKEKSMSADHTSSRSAQNRHLPLCCTYQPEIFQNVLWVFYRYMFQGGHPKRPSPTACTAPMGEQRLVL
jgi:hypothetical protein